MLRPRRAREEKQSRGDIKYEIKIKEWVSGSNHFMDCVYGTRHKSQKSQCMSVRVQVVLYVLLDSRMNRPALGFLQFLTSSIESL